MKRVDIPLCCLDCEYLELDYNEFTEEELAYCQLNLKFPIKKRKCKKQKPLKF